MGGREEIVTSNEILLLDYTGSTQNPEAGANQPLIFPSSGFCPHLQDKQWAGHLTSSHDTAESRPDLQPPSAVLPGVSPTLSSSTPTGLGAPVLLPQSNPLPHPHLSFC